MVASEVLHLLQVMLDEEWREDRQQHPLFPLSHDLSWEGMGESEEEIWRESTPGGASCVFDVWNQMVWRKGTSVGVSRNCTPSRLFIAFLEINSVQER